MIAHNPAHNPAHWRKSSFSISVQNCVELADTGPTVLLRDSKHPGDGHLSFSRGELAELLTACERAALDPLA